MIYTDPEIWKEIEGYNGKYLISNHGRIKSFSQKVRNRFPEGFITLGNIDTTRYYVFRLGTSKTDRIGIRVHTLVATYFKEKPTNAECVNHLDGNRLNNHHSNLEWCTLSENIKHAVRTGLMDLKGEKHPHAKLTESNVIEMRRLRNEEGLIYQEIANRFGIERRQASDVVRGINWGWLKEGLLS